MPCYSLTLLNCQKRFVLGLCDFLCFQQYANWLTSTHLLLGSPHLVGSGLFSWKKKIEIDLGRYKSAFWNNAHIQVYSPIHKYITQLVDMVTGGCAPCSCIRGRKKKAPSASLQPNDIDPMEQLIPEYSNRDHTGCMKNLSKLNGF